MQKVITLLLSEKHVDEEPAPTAVSKAVTEKPITKAAVKAAPQILTKQKPLAQTRRHIISASDKKYLAKTRRAVRRQ